MEALRLSLGSAAALGLCDTQLAAQPTTVYSMVGETCAGNCLFCTQARNSSADRRFLSRVVWPEFALPQVLAHLGRANGLARVCVQTLNYPGLISDLLNVVAAIRAVSPLPISVCMNPVGKAQLASLRDAGVDRVGVGLDCATPETFQRMKPGFSWSATVRFIEETVEVFGTGSIHLIVGLGDSDEDIIAAIQRFRDEEGYVGLFAYTPMRGTQLTLTPPAVERYRALQLARYLITTRRARYEDMEFVNGKLTGLGAPPDELEAAWSTGNAFRTSGCPGCNRPMYNERPGGVMYNYPGPLTSEERQAAQGDVTRYLATQEQRCDNSA